MLADVRFTEAGWKGDVVTDEILNQSMVSTSVGATPQVATNLWLQTGLRFEEGAGSR